MKSRFKFFLYMISGQQSMAVKSAGPRVGVCPVGWPHRDLQVYSWYQTECWVPTEYSVEKTEYSVETIYTGGVIMG